MNYPTYTVTVTREDNLWVAVVTEGLDEGSVGAADFERFADIDVGMREILADLTGREPEQLTISWRYELGEGDETQLVTEYFEAEQLAKQMDEWRDDVRVRLVNRLNGRLSQRAIADLLGLSHQRVNQLTHATVGVPRTDYTLTWQQAAALLWTHECMQTGHIPRHSTLDALTRWRRVFEGLSDVASERGESVDSVAEEALAYLHDHSADSSG